MWPRTTGLTASVQVPQPVNRRLPASPQATSLISQDNSIVATAGGLDDEAGHPQDSSPYEDTDSQEVEPSHQEDEGLYIPVTLRRLYRMILFCRLRWPCLTSPGDELQEVLHL